MGYRLQRMKPFTLVCLSLMLALSMVLTFLVPAQQAAAATYEERFMQLYDQIKDPANGYFSPEGIPYHSVETLMSEAPDYGHMTTSEAYSYWLWLEALYGYYTGDWSKLEAAWDNMETYIIPVNEDGNEEQPTMSYYDPSDPATYAAEHPYPDMYPSEISGEYPAGQDPLDAELTNTYGSNETYLMHWLLDVDNWYGFGNLLNPDHTATYVNTFQRGEQESVWEAVTHPSQDDKTFGAEGEGFMSLFTAEDSDPAAQWRYTAATDADARAVQVMYWAKELGYDNQEYLDKAKKMGDFLRYGMYDKYFQEIGSAADGSPTPGSGKSSSHFLMAWYTAWGGGLGDTGQWAWRIGASHTHQAYQNTVAAYALSTEEGGLIPESPTAQEDWAASLTRQLEFYTWLQSAEGAIGGGATNSWGGDYSAYPSGVSTFYGMAYDEDPVYHDPPSNTWFGFQTWPVERIAELYYIFAQNGDTSSEEFQMAKTVIENWVDWAMDYTFVNEEPVTDEEGYFLDPNGNRIMGGDDPNVDTVSAPGEFYILSGQEWEGQPDTWNGFENYTGNPDYHVIAKGVSQDVGVLGSLIKTLTFYAAGTQAENGSYTAQGDAAKNLAAELLDVAWNYNDGIGIATEEERADYHRFFKKEIYFPDGWTGTYGQGNTIPGPDGIPSDPERGGDGVYISYHELRPEIKNDPQWDYLENLYNTSWNPETEEWENGVPTFTYHRFWAQVDMATAYAEFDRLIGTLTAPDAPANLTATEGDTVVELSWDSVSGADSYNVKRATTSGGPYNTVATVDTTSYTDTSVSNGTTYYYVVSAENSVGESDNSSEVSATPNVYPPGDFELSAAAGDGQVELSWTESLDADSYDVLRSTDGTNFTAVAEGLTATSYTDTSVTNGTTYDYQVVAENSAGTTESNVVSATPSASLPGDFTLSAQAGDGEVALSWTVSSDADSYDVLRSTDGTNFTAVAEDLTATSYTDTSVTNGTTYDYKVVAENSAGTTESNVVSATPEQPQQSDLKLQYRDGDYGSSSNNQIKPHFNIVNTGDTDVDLSELTIRYWYTIDGEQSQQFHCDYARIGCGNINGSFASMSSPADGADYYLEISFSSGAGTLAAGSETGEIQARFNKSNWSNYDESNDYSYDGSKTSFADWDRIGLYQNGELIYGIEP